MRSPGRGAGVQFFSAPRTSVRGAGHTSGWAENNNKIMAPNAHPGHGSHVGRSLPSCASGGEPACRGAARSAGRDRRVRRWAGREAGREGGNRLIKRIQRGGRLSPPPRPCPRRARERRAPPAAAAGGRSPRTAPPSPAWRGAAASSASSAAASRRTRSPRGRPQPPAAAPPPPPRPSGAPRSPTGAPRRRSSIPGRAAVPGARRPPRPSSPRPRGKRDSGRGDRRAGHGWGRGFCCRGGKSVSRSRLPCRVRPSLLAEPCWQTAAPVWISNSQPCARSRGRLPGPNLSAAGVCQWLLLFGAVGLFCAGFFWT